MCLAVPVRVEEITDEFTARVRLGEGESFTSVSTMLLERQPEPGEYLIVHAGFALNILDPADAEESLRLLRQIADQDEALCTV